MHVTITIHELMGDKVLTLVNSSKSAGISTIEWELGMSREDLYQMEYIFTPFKQGNIG